MNTSAAEYFSHLCTPSSTLATPGPPSCPPSTVPSINLCSGSNCPSQQHHQPEHIYVNTVQYQIILLHGCVKWLGHPFGSSSLLTIFGCVSNPFSAQPWSCGSSAWRHCVSVDPYGAEHREGGTHSPPSASHTHFTRLGLAWDLGSGGWGGGDGNNGGSLEKHGYNFTVIPPVKLKDRWLRILVFACLWLAEMSDLSLGENKLGWWLRFGKLYDSNC